MAYMRTHGSRRGSRASHTYGPRMRMRDGRSCRTSSASAPRRAPDRLTATVRRPRTLLLRRRSGGGLVRLLWSDREGAHEPGQPCGNDHHGLCRAHPGPVRIARRDRSQAAAVDDPRYVSPTFQSTARPWLGARVPLEDGLRPTIACSDPGCSVPEMRIVVTAAPVSSARTVGRLTWQPARSSPSSTTYRAAGARTCPRLRASSSATFARPRRPAWSSSASRSSEPPCSTR